MSDIQHRENCPSRKSHWWNKNPKHIVGEVKTYTYRTGPYVDKIEEFCECSKCHKRKKTLLREYDVMGNVTKEFKETL